MTKYSNNHERQVDELNSLLANYNVFYQKLRCFHWNVKGRDFFDLHDKFEELYNISKSNIDAIAERILMLGYYPLSTMKEYLDRTALNEGSQTQDSNDMITEVLDDMNFIRVQLRNAINMGRGLSDFGTSHILEGFLIELEKQTWMLQTWMDDVAPMMVRRETSTASVHKS